jgi:hypothetical protein
VEHRGTQGGEPGEDAPLIPEDAFLGRGRRGEDRAERAEFSYEAVGPAGGTWPDRLEEFTQELSAP